ncbi:hypothetical protein CBR_g30076 [Chara braunii]|uniref:Uncharacterized protein n=1 Tax=Chara braunii TaxID=69332 RepID=A0A388LC89_CHABU|nr:hypothetical protein CBR_g30076 [Chara braunii]|eukprot:GBG79813.1 hypothetical protein CBR_g30076 [Chara braunii]
MAEGCGFAKILRWRSSCLMKVLLNEVLQEPMPPDLCALLFQGRNLSSFLRDFQDFCLVKTWDKKAMWYMFPLFVCEGLSEEVYALKQKAETWDELESSLRLRFSEDGMEGQPGECPVPPSTGAPSQAELSGLQRQVGALEERLARLEEARRGELKVSEDSLSKPTDQGEKGVGKDDQEPPLSIGTPKRRAGVQARGRGEQCFEAKEEQNANMALPVIVPDPKRGLINMEAPSAAGRERQKSGWWPEHWVEEVRGRWERTGRTPRGSEEVSVTGEKGELGPPKLTKAQRKARNRAQGGQGTEKGQCPRQEVAAPREMEGEFAQKGPLAAEQALYRQWTPYDRMGVGPEIGMDFFKGYHVSKFIEKFGRIAAYYEWSEERMLKEVIRFIHIGLKDEVDRLIKGAGSSWRKFCDDMRHKYWLGEEHPARSDPEKVPRSLVAQTQPRRPLQLPPQQVSQGGGTNEEGQRQGARRGRENGGRDREGRSGSRGGFAGWENDISRHCAKEGHIIKFCWVRRADEASGLIRTDIEGNVFDRTGEYIDPTIPGGTRKEALRRDGASSTAS